MPHSFPDGSVTFPPASLTNKTPEHTSQRLRFLSQKASNLPAETYARSNAAEPILLKPAEFFVI